MSIRESMAARERDLEREDLLSFIQAALACTGQDEFHGDAAGQAVSIGFFHDYVRGNYRRMYAHCLAAGVNDYNRAKIILELLGDTSGTSIAQRREEGRLIAASLPELPPPRVYRIFEQLVERRVNNRRARRIVRDYMASRAEPELHTLKYRRRVARIAAHFHLRLAAEESALLFRPDSVRRFETPLFETFRRAHYEKRAIYELPYTVAEGLAARQQIPREAFLRGIAPRLTKREQLRLQSSAAAHGVETLAETHLGRHSLTRLAIYFLSLAVGERRERFDELDAAMGEAARRIVRRSTFGLGRVALVADNSYSSSGSVSKRRRPLALALATHYLLRAAAAELRTYWTSPVGSLAELHPRGHTDLATPLLEALAGRPELLILVSDGYDNDPPGGAAEVVRVFRERLDRAGATTLVHLSPSYDATSYTVKTIHPAMHSLGIRDVEGIPTLLTFIRFAAGDAELDELRAHLEGCARDMIDRKERAP